MYKSRRANNVLEIHNSFPIRTTTGLMLPFLVGFMKKLILKLYLFFYFLCQSMWIINNPEELRNKKKNIV